ncbi:glycoside hydrolase family 10 protein [Deinococcus navajonensis]|uniref:Glycoside hydrolase family 10 protein n=1 Tax=Deinococcus navajonensis TaxID=309884 RepID=A0ABV8XUC1_9DEIO
MSPFRRAAPLVLPLMLGPLMLGTAVAQVPAPPSTPPSSVALAPTGSSVRGLWVDAFGPGLKTRAQVRQTVEDAANLGINTLFVQAIRRGDCLCLKSTLPVITDADLERNFDPLAVITDLAHARGLRVIAWASVTGVSNTAAPNTSPRHVTRAHGPQSGAASWMARRPDGSWLEGKDGWLDAGIPEAAEYMAAGVVSLVRNYPVDGVQLDRIRYPDGGVWGYDPKVLSRYRAETGARGTPSANDARWQTWKRDQITGLVRRIALEVKGLRPDAWVSAATITYVRPPADRAAFRQTRTYLEVMQDWPTWMQEGLLDLNVLMNYKRDGTGDQAQWFDGWNAFARTVRARPDGRMAGLAAGTAMYLNPPEVTAVQAARSVAAGLGWVGYSYRTPTVNVFNTRESGAQGLAAVRAVLTAPGGVLATPARWTEAPPTARGLMGRITGTPVPGHHQVTLWRGGRQIAQSLTDGNGYYGFLTVEPGQVEVRVSGQRWADTVPERGVVRLPDLLVRQPRPVVVPVQAPAPTPEPVKAGDEVPTPP